ncbi:MAG TPA: putative C-S lyase [Phycisphaerales bacterium]|nr:putative C-S lyase [Phycisphaerales bacterium]
MKFDFDRVLDRRNTDSLKWDKYKGRDVLPLWVADMDFQAPPAVINALHKRVDDGIFGYAVPGDELVEVIVTRLWERYRWKIQPSWIVWLPGLVPALNVACRTFGNDGDEVLTFTPVYPPFLSAPRLSGRKLKTIPLRRENDLYTFDVERFESEISPRSKLFLLCNPHNPVGRRYNRKELESIAGVCMRHSIVICSDEVHCDLVLDGGEHVPTATLSDEAAVNTVTLMSASKTFNLPGLNCAFAVIANERLRKSFIGNRMEVIPSANAMGYAACLAAYRDCEDWRIGLIDYLRSNRDIVYEFINDKIPRLSMDDVEATYLAWIDAGSLGVPAPDRFFEQAGVGLSDGGNFQGEGYVRLNFGCPRETLLKALDRMKRAVADLTGPA